MDKIVEQVTKKGKPSAMAMKRFESEIKRIASNKINVICNKYPLKSMSEKVIICNGGGRLRTASELRSCLKTNANRYSDGFQLKQVFDIEKEMEVLKKENDKVEELRNKIISKINTDVGEIINSVYFGESNLAELLKEFNDKEYT